MDATIGKFLTILKAALEGKPAVLTGETATEEWETLFHMAGIHHVLPLVYGAVHRDPSLAKLEPGYLAGLRRSVMQQVGSQTRRTVEFLE